LFDHILPKTPLLIEVVGLGKGTSGKSGRNRRQRIAAIKGKCNVWEVERYSGTEYSKDKNHDRYLLITTPNGSYEVMLSSGFIYLWKQNKEITCVIREI
jgi:hypothetical protein